MVNRDAYWFVPGDENKGGDNDEIQRDRTGDCFRADPPHRRIERDFVLTERQQLVRIDLLLCRRQKEGHGELRRLRGVA